MSSITSLFSQQYYFPEALTEDQNTFDNKVSELAVSLSKDYAERDKKKFYTNLIDIQILSGRYAEALVSIDSLRIIAGQEYPEEANLMVAERYLYADAMRSKKTNFETAYTNSFKKLYDPLTEKAKLFLPRNFDIHEDELQRKIDKLLLKRVGKDSITKSNAIQLVSLCTSKKITKETKKMAFTILDREDEKRYIIEDSIAIKTKDNATVALQMAIKKGDITPRPTMLIFSIYPYESGVIDKIALKEAAYYGYNGVFASTRGKHFSPDDIEPFEHDATDAYEVIDWISKQPWSDGQVGMMGSSYRGFSQWAAAKKLHPALKTIVPQVAVGTGLDYPMENNVFMSYMIRWINFVTTNKFIDLENFLDTQQWSKVYRAWYASGKSFRALDSLHGKPNKIFQRWLDHPSYDDYWQNMVASKEDFAHIDIPVLTTTGYYDSDQVGALHYHREHIKRNKNANHYLLIGPYNHSGAAGRTAKKVRGLTVDSIAKLDMDVLAYQWFDYIFKGAEKPKILKDKVNYQVTGANIWKHKPTLRDMNDDTLVLYLDNVREGKDYKLTLQKPDSKEYIRQELDFMYRGDSIQKRNSIYAKEIQMHNQVSFVSEAFTKPFDINGAFLADLYAEINKKDVDIILEIFEMKADGSYLQLSNYLGRASYAKNPGKRQLLVPGKREFIPFSNSYFTSNRIEKGSKLVLLLGLHKSPSWQINYGTGKDVSDETIADGKIPLQVKWFSDSAIKIPISTVK
ncbi:hypothetical protein GCM10022393_40540 [Aquimarina addita]|uniref:Xaa-Pro dipeptidyl-peptidase C-terminal domain-containing protein n=1 Tax=Aquimarina addita TaxID=870485 RepID=A0ABP6UWU2_9FLAO